MNDETTPPRYCIGIDLGTTNCVLAFADTQSAQKQVETFLIPQWVDTDVIESRVTLPSFLIALPSEISSGNNSSAIGWLSRSAGPGIGLEDNTPGTQFRSGEMARRIGAMHPGRLIASAKSWLSHAGVDRSADLLPWQGASDVPRHSPAWASAAYLGHLRAAWDDAHPDAPLAQQQVTITLPASFDEVARELTVQAAKLAGLPRIGLIEEPQAAFYAWIDRHRQDWTSLLSAGQLILVCDIGGGTTDLTLIRVRVAEGDQQCHALQFHRVAVGQHLILGGDNIDLAIARFAESKLTSELPPRQWQRLVAASRSVKETMLAENRPTQTTIHLPGEGSSLLGGAVDVTITASEIDELVLNGFFPSVPLNSTAVRGHSGFQEVGLPYAADPAISKHLAEFLTLHRRTGIDDPAIDSDRVDWVLFNGGVLASPKIQQRIVDSLQGWFSNRSAEPIVEQIANLKPQTLPSPRLDLAVAQGAAYFGLVQQGILLAEEGGVRIAANLARAYFLQVNQDPPTAICIIAADAQAGQSFRVDMHPMILRIGVPVVFSLWVSSTRLADRIGDAIEIDATEMTPLPPIQTVLQDRKRRDSKSLDVVIETSLTEIGTVEVYCVTVNPIDAPEIPPRRWKMEFDIRTTYQTDLVAHQGMGESAGIVDEATMQDCRDQIRAVFAPDGKAAPSKLIKELQSTLNQSREGWPPVVLRQLWECLIEFSEGRRRSSAHESRWLNLLGFSLRPGFGVAVDDWRTATTWRTVFGKIAHGDPQVRTESWILWRRIVGGLSSGQQLQLLSAVRKCIDSGQHGDSAELVEAWRLSGGLEQLPIVEKLALSTNALATLRRSKSVAMQSVLIASIGRIHARVPLGGPLNLVISPQETAKMVKQILAFPVSLANQPAIVASLGLALAQMTRRCNDRFRDVDSSTRSDVLNWMKRNDVKEHLIELVHQGGTLDREEQTALLGDVLPLGISMRQS